MCGGRGGSLPAAGGQAGPGAPFLLDRAVHPGPSCLPGGASATLGACLSVTDFWHQKNTDYNNSPFHISQCFVLKLSDLQAVNVGLFDQYFRLTGECRALSYFG